MLIFTHRESVGRADESAFDTTFSARSARLALAKLERAPHAAATGWKVSQTDSDVDDADSMQVLLPMFQGPGPLLVYLHGYNSTPAACFERCDRLQSLYGLEVVRFSWSSIKCLLHDSGQPALVAGFNLGLQQDFKRLCGTRHCVQPSESPALIGLAAGNLQGLTCSWWLVMALTGQPSRHDP